MLALKVIPILLGAYVVFMIAMLVLFWRGSVKNTTYNYEEERKEKRAKKEEKKEIERAKRVARDNPYLLKYYEALEAKDREGMMEALVECKEHCSAANSYCLSEVFCPDCPMGGLVVQSARYGM